MYSLNDKFLKPTEQVYARKIYVLFVHVPHYVQFYPDALSIRLRLL